MSDSLIHVVVPVHNGSRYLDELVRSLADQTQPPQQVHLVDNGSAESPWSVPEEFSSFVSVHHREQMLGFGAACNQGIVAACSQGAEGILILNQDLVLERHACQFAADAWRRHSNAGVIGLCQLSYDGRSIDPPFRNILPPSLVDDLLLREVQDVYECEFVPAAAVLIPMTVIRQVGGFDPLYFMYQEDKDYCRRVRNAGFNVLICTSARVRHDCGQQRAIRDNRWRANWYYSRAIYHLKWSRRPLWISFLTSVKYMVPHWNRREAWSWLRGIFRSMAHYRELRQRREKDDGLAIIQKDDTDGSPRATVQMTA